MRLLCISPSERQLQGWRKKLAKNNRARCGSTGAAAPGSALFFANFFRQPCNTLFDTQCKRSIEKKILLHVALDVNGGAVHSV